MATVYLIMGVAGATVLILQLAFSLLGFDHHGFETDHFDAAAIDLGHADMPTDQVDSVEEVVHADGSTFLKMLSVRAVVSAVTFFGWTGLAALKGGWTVWLSLSVATASGLVAMYVMATMLKFLSRLHAEGNVDIWRALGRTGTVYLSIPPSGKGAGKIHVGVQTRTMEYNAVSEDESLPSGASIEITDIIDEDTVQVRSTAHVEVIR